MILNPIAISCWITSKSSINMHKPAHKTTIPGLFGIDLAQMNRPTLEPVTPWPLTLKLAAEAEAVGFYLTGHPMDAFSRELNDLMSCLQA